MQEYLVAVRGFCSRLTSARLQQLTPGQVQRLQDFLACQQTKHDQSAAELDTFGDMVLGAVTAACHAALEHLEAHLSQACPHTSVQLLAPRLPCSPSPATQLGLPVCGSMLVGLLLMLLGLEHPHHKHVHRQAAL